MTARPATDPLISRATAAMPGALLEQVQVAGGLVICDLRVGDSDAALRALAAAAETIPGGVPRMTARRTSATRIEVTLFAGPPTTHTVAVRVPPPVRDGVFAERERTGAPAGTQLYARLEEHREQLGEVLGASRRRLGIQTGAPRRRRIAAVQLWVTLTAAQLAELDRAAATWCSGNRSALATQLLSATAPQAQRPTWSPR